MRELILLNPRGKRRKARKGRSSRRNKMGRFVRRNAPKRKKKKISKAVAPKTKKTPMAKKTTRRRRKSTFKSRARKSVRRFTRRARRLGRGTSKTIVGQLKSIVSKDNLQVAGGVVASSVLSNYVVNNFRTSLPMSDNKYAVAAYRALIPALGAFAARRFAPKFADGLIIGGLASGIQAVIETQFAGLANYSSYVDAAPSPMLNYPTGSSMTPITGSVDSGSRMNANVVAGYSGIYDSPNPFETNAWGN